MRAAPSLARRFGSGVFWNAVATLTLQGGTFLTNLVVANLLGAALYGRFGIVVGTAQTIGGVLQFSTGMAATRYLGELRERDPERAGRAFALFSRLSYGTGVLAALLLLAGAAPLAGAVLHEPTLRDTLWIAAPVALCSIVMGFQFGALIGLDGHRHAAIAYLPLLLLQLGSIAAATHAFGLVGAVAAMSGNLLLRTAVTHALLQREVRRWNLAPRWRWDDYARSLTWGFLLPGSLTGLTALPALWLATLGLTRHAEGFREVAYFQVALALRAALMILPWIVNSVGLSLLAQHAGRARTEQRLLLASAALGAASVGFGALAIWLFGDDILRLYGPEYQAALPALQVLLLSLAAEALALPLYQSLAARDRLWRTFWFAMLPRDLTVGLLGAWIGARHGAAGLAWIHALGWGVTLLASSLLVMRFAPARTATGNPG